MYQPVRLFLSACILLTLSMGIVPIPSVHAASTWTVTNNLNSGAGSLRQAMLDAGDGDTIEFSANFTITLSSQLPVVDGRTITIHGKGASSTILQASICNPVTLPGNCSPASHRIFEIGLTGGLILDGLTVRHGNCDGACATDLYAGGGVYNQGILTVSNSIFSSNSAIHGGGMYNHEGDLTLTDMTFSGNHASNGGGLYVAGSNPMITNVTFSGNSAISNGGGLYNINSNPALENTTFLANSASTNGGGMYNDASSPVIMSVTFLGNSANFGGGIHNFNGSSPAITGSTFSGNSATYQGGGIRNSGSNPNIMDSTFANNDAQNGGGISNFNSNPSISNCSFLDNSAASGAGIYGYASSITITNSVLSDNSATVDGGGMYNESSSLTITDSTFSGNNAPAGGGGMFNYYGTLTVTNSTFSGNTTANGGGGMFNRYVSSPMVTNTTFSGNTAETNGGGMFNDASSPAVLNSTFSGNSAGLAGGGLFNQNGGKPVLKNVILWGDTTTGTGPEMNGAAQIISYSIIQGSGGSASWDTSLGTDGGNNLDADPLLDPLADNGGPTQTMALLVESPAIDSGTNSGCPLTDQRGMTRPFGSHCDIGAYEFVNQAPTDIDISNDKIDENLPAGTTVGALSTVDPNAGDLFVYSFCGGADDPSFSIAGNTLKTAAVFDYEVKAGYSICIKSTDLGGLSTTKTFVISVNNLIDSQTFADVPLSYWAWQYIERLYNAGITGGCTVSPLNYCPEDLVTRAQMAVFLEKGVHYPASFTAPNVAPTFTDTIGHWAEDWIEALKSDGITAGCALDLYCPEEPVTRAQMAVFLLKSRHGVSYTPPAATGVFTDVPVGYWADKWIEQLAAEGITGGCGPGIYCPDDPVTRAQMAVFLVKTFNLP